jgi:putative intracellular protease/amidase
MQIAILLYHRFTALDAIGPYEVLRLLPRLSWCSSVSNPVR